MISMLQHDQESGRRTNLPNKPTFSMLHSSPLLVGEAQGHVNPFAPPPASAMKPAEPSGGSMSASATPMSPLTWRGHTREDLQRLCLATFCILEDQIDLLLPTVEGSGDGFTRLQHSSDYQAEWPLEHVGELTAGTLVEVSHSLWRPLLVMSAAENGLSCTLSEDLKVLEPFFQLKEQTAAPKLTLKQHLYLVLNKPSSSMLALCAQMTILLLIVVSTVSFCWETIPAYYTHGDDFTVFTYIEMCCIACFTLELAVRFVVDTNPREFFMDLMNVIDLVAILPFYMEMLFVGGKVAGLSTLRIARLARLLRILRVSQGSIDLLSKTLKRSLRPLYMLVFVTCIGMLLFATVIYYIERGTWDHDMGLWMRRSYWNCPHYCTEWPTAPCPLGTEGEYVESFPFTIKTPELRAPNGSLVGCSPIYEQSPFESIPAACWWAIVTMTTVGYGEIVPVSTLGKMWGMLVQLCGILVIALPTTVIGSNFTYIYEKVARATLEGGVASDTDSDNEDEDTLSSGVRYSELKQQKLERRVSKRIFVTASRMARDNVQGLMGLVMDNKPTFSRTITKTQIAPS